MRSSLRFSVVVSATALSTMLWHGCINEKQGSLFDPNTSFTPAPTITSITPSAGAQAAVDTLRITGTNFSSSAQYNFAYFNSTVASLLQVSPTQIVLAAPFVLGDSVRVRMGVQGADQLSNLVYYKLSAAIEAFGNLTPQEFARAISTDASGNLYASLSNASSDIGVRKYTAGGDTTHFAPPTALVQQWFSLKVGPGGYVYAVRNSRGVFRYNPGG
ncbi:MAG: IPT/TIG domain-containing protein, partial [Ignavibacteriales bacterium]|nr:IPT/TIG domain-containing protein [Ignavibacteriales bacterium]